MAIVIKGGGGSLPINTLKRINSEEPSVEDSGVWLKTGTVDYSISNYPEATVSVDTSRIFDYAGQFSYENLTGSPDDDLMFHDGIVYAKDGYSIQKYSRSGSFIETIELNGIIPSPPDGMAEKDGFFWILTAPDQIHKFDASWNLVETITMTASFSSEPHGLTWFDAANCWIISDTNSTSSTFLRKVSEDFQSYLGGVTTSQDYAIPAASKNFLYVLDVPGERNVIRFDENFQEVETLSISNLGDYVEGIAVDKVNGEMALLRTFSYDYIRFYKVDREVVGVPTAFVDPETNLPYYVRVK